MLPKSVTLAEFVEQKGNYRKFRLDGATRTLIKHKPQPTGHPSSKRMSGRLVCTYFPQSSLVQQTKILNIMSVWLIRDILPIIMDYVSFKKKEIPYWDHLRTLLFHQPPKCKEIRDHAHWKLLLSWIMPLQTRHSPSVHTTRMLHHFAYLQAALYLRTIALSSLWLFLRELCFPMKQMRRTQKEQQKT